MRKTIVYCDRCQKDVTETMYASFAGMDFCEECCEHVRQIILDDLNKEPETEQQPAADPAPEEVKPEETKPEEPKEQKPRKKTVPLDTGKMAALYNAGWSYEDIADEMMCSRLTVQAKISELRVAGKVTRKGSGRAKMEGREDE